MPFISNQGCYESICEDGMLKIIIENATFTCHESGQVIEVALVKDEEWLHDGSTICPSCMVHSAKIWPIHNCKHLLRLVQGHETYFDITSNAPSGP